jgi:cytochrome c biogenesis protein CcmG, thiol:disulfide interchange protein DsbE
VTESEHAAPRRRRLAPFVALAVAAVVAGLFVVLAGSDASTNETADTPLLDEPAPEAVGVRADGSAFDLARRKGSWVVLNFFTSTCVPCQQEHPDLVRFADQQADLGGDGAELYTVVYDDDRKAVEDFFAANGGDWPVVYDDDGSIAVSFGVSQVPETWIIDPTGVVRGRIITRVTADYLGNQLQQLRELAG